MASQRGLGALTIGDLAKEIGMSKSGLFAHFGSKEDLQIATIEAAEILFAEAIIKPVCDAPPGLARLGGLLEGYIRYLENSIFAGGCFFAAAAAEFDDRPGRVRDRIVVSMRKWGEIIESEASAALQAGEIEAGIEPAQLAFELKGVANHANFVRRLLGDESALARARKGIHDRLWSASTAKGRELLG